MTVFIWSAFALLDALLILLIVKSVPEGGGILILMLLISSFALAYELNRSLTEDGDRTPPQSKTEHNNLQNANNVKTEYSIKITRGSGKVDLSDYSKRVNIMYIRKSILYKKMLVAMDIKSLISSSTIVLLLGFLGGGAVWACSDPSTDFSPVKHWLVMIYGMCMIIAALKSLPGLPIAVSMVKKINGGNFVLIKAKIIHIYEDLRHADSETNPDCYLTCEYNMDNIQKHIKFKKSGTEAKTFLEKQTAYFLFLTDNGVMEGTPRILLLGKNYEVGNDIKVIS